MVGNNNIDSRLIDLAIAVESRKIDISNAAAPFRDLIKHILVMRDIEDSMSGKFSEGVIANVASMYTSWFDKTYGTKFHDQIGSARYDEVRGVVSRFKDEIHDKIRARLESMGYTEEITSYLTSA